MSRDLNRSCFTGRLTRDPKLRYTSSGKAITDLAMAINESWKGDDGEWRNKAVFIDLNAWDKTGEIIANRLRKGDSIYVEARYSIDEWDDKTSGEKRRSPKFTVLDWKKFDSTKSGETPSVTSPQNPATPENDDQEIPF